MNRNKPVTENKNTEPRIKRSDMNTNRETTIDDRWMQIKPNINQGVEKGIMSLSLLVRRLIGPPLDAVYATNHNDQI
jgi:hypothetical protein